MGSSRSDFPSSLNRDHQSPSWFRRDPSSFRTTKGHHAGDRYVRIVGHAPDDSANIGPNMGMANLEDDANRKALAVLSSDAFSCMAYASEVILRILLIAGLGALSLSMPIGAGITFLAHQYGILS